jgi:hypothetical protein
MRVQEKKAKTKFIWAIAGALSTLFCSQPFYQVNVSQKKKTSEPDALPSPACHQK